MLCSPLPPLVDTEGLALKLETTHRVVSHGGEGLVRVIGIDLILGEPGLVGRQPLLLGDFIHGKTCRVLGAEVSGSAVQ